MPYASISELPSAVKKRSTKAQEAFRHAFNEAHSSGKSEEESFKIAWAAAEHLDGMQRITAARNDGKNTNRLVALIRARRAGRPVRKSIPRQAHPLNLEREYGRALVGMMEIIHYATKAAVVHALQNSELVNHHDAARTSKHAVVPLVESIRLEMETKFPAERLGLVAQGYGMRTAKFNKVAMGDQISAVIGVDPIANLVEPKLPGIMDAFVADNVTLIQSIPERYFSEVHALVSDAVSTGRRAEDVSADMQARFDVSESRANLIARDQVSKLNGQLTEARQTAIGVKGYTWRTSNDERVRETHQELEGTAQSWDDPPEINDEGDVGHPGEDFQCRCRAEPDLGPLLGETQDEG